MKQLLTKLETLLDEAIGLIREERQRRALQFVATPSGAPVLTVNPAPWNPFDPSERIPGINWERVETSCAPPPFMGSTFTICETRPGPT